MEEKAQIPVHWFKDSIYSISSPEFDISCLVSCHRANRNYLIKYVSKNK